MSSDNLVERVRELERDLLPYKDKEARASQGHAGDPPARGLSPVAGRGRRGRDAAAIPFTIDADRCYRVLMQSPIRDPEILHAINKLRANGDDFAARTVEGIFRRNQEQGAAIAELRERITNMIGELDRIGR